MYLFAQETSVRCLCWEPGKHQAGFTVGLEPLTPQANIWKLEEDALVPVLNTAAEAT